MSARTDRSANPLTFTGQTPGVWLRLAPAMLIVVPLMVLAVGLAVLQSFGIFPVTGRSNRAWRPTAPSSRAQSSGDR